MCDAGPSRSQPMQPPAVNLECSTTTSNATGNLPSHYRLERPDNAVENLICSTANSSSVHSVEENAQQEEFKSRVKRRSSFGPFQERAAPRHSICVTNKGEVPAVPRNISKEEKYLWLLQSYTNKYVRSIENKYCARPFVEPLAKKFREAVFEVVEDSAKTGLVPGKRTEADNRMANLEKYLSSLEEENEGWKKLLSERKKDYKEAKQRLAAVERGGKSHDATSLLKEEDKGFLGTCPNYDAISSNARSDLQHTALQSFEKYAKAHKLRKDAKKNETLLKTARQQLMHAASRDIHDPKAVMQNVLQSSVEEGQRF